MSLGDLLPSQVRPGLWLHPDVAAWSSGLPPHGDGAGATGRGAVGRESCGSVRAILRRYRRGGLLRRLLPDAFVSDWRARREVAALQRLSALGLSPRCLGLQVDGILLKRISLAVEEIEGSRDLLLHAAAGAVDPVPVARAAGAAVKAMHDAGVSHRDLNAANVLVRREASSWRAFIVDLDGARLHDGPVPEALRLRQVLRLCRSADKWQPTATAPVAARAAFLCAALPRPLVRPAWRAAAQRQQLRRALGRVPRPLR